MPVDVEVRLVAMYALAHGIGHPPYGENVATAVQGEGVVGVKPLAGKDFLMNRRQTQIVCLEGVG